MYFDLENRLRTGGQFRSELGKRQERLARLDQLLLRDQGYLAEYHQVLRELLEFCRFNFGLLTPYFWPAYRSLYVTPRHEQLQTYINCSFGGAVAAITGSVFNSSKF
jgi:hypothetical protein